MTAYKYIIRIKFDQQKKKLNEIGYSLSTRSHDFSIPIYIIMNPFIDSNHTQQSK